MRVALTVGNFPLSVMFAYPLCGTNVFKIQNSNTCCKEHLNTNTKYIKINAFKYKSKIQYFAFQIRICILNYKCIQVWLPSLIFETSRIDLALSEQQKLNEKLIILKFGPRLMVMKTIICL